MFQTFSTFMVPWHFILACQGMWLSVRKYVARIMTAIIFDTEMGKHYVCCWGRIWRLFKGNIAEMLGPSWPSVCIQYTVIPYMLLDLVSNCFSNVWSQVEQNLSNAKRRKLRHQGAPNHTKWKIGKLVKLFVTEMINALTLYTG